MRFWKGPKATAEEKIARATDLLKEAGFTVDANKNILEGTLVIGSFDQYGNVRYPVLHEHLPMMKGIRDIIFAIGESMISSENWKPNP